MTIDEKTWKLWKEYRHGQAWAGCPTSFKHWLAQRQKKNELNWENGKAHLDLDGFHVVLSVDYDDYMNATENYGEYVDARKDHYSIDRFEGNDHHRRRYQDHRRRYYVPNEYATYKEQRSSWLNVYAPRVIEAKHAEGLTLYERTYTLDARHKLTKEDVEVLTALRYGLIKVNGRVVRRCRYSGKYTKSKSQNDLQARKNLEESKARLDSWYNDQWFYYSVNAVAFKDGVELGSANLGGVESDDQETIDGVAFDAAYEAVQEAKARFEKEKGTPESRCALIKDICVEAESYTATTPIEFDAWLGYLYAAIACGTVLCYDTTVCEDFIKFFREHEDLDARTKMYKREDT